MSEVAGPVAVGERVQSAGDLQEAAGQAGLPGAIWRKSSWSAHNGNCVEVASGSQRGIGVRDSMDPGGPVLRFTPDEWRAFLSRMR